MVQISDVTDYYKAKRLSRRKRHNIQLEGDREESPYNKRKINKQYFQKLRKAMTTNRKKLRGDLIEIYDEIETCDCAHDLRVLASLKKIRKTKFFLLFGKIMFGFAAFGLFTYIVFAIWQTLTIDETFQVLH